MWSRFFLAEGAPERSRDDGGESLVPESMQPVGWAPEGVSDGRTEDAVEVSPADEGERLQEEVVVDAPHSVRQSGPGEDLSEGGGYRVQRVLASQQVERNDEEQGVLNPIRQNLTRQEESVCHGKDACHEGSMEEEQVKAENGVFGYKPSEELGV